MSELERRKSARQSFVGWQLVADYDGLTLPIDSDFYRVQVQNISTGGMAYLSSRKPMKKYLLVTLNSGVASLIGRVVWTFWRADLKEWPFEVGCEFVLRLNSEFSSAPDPLLPLGPPEFDWESPCPLLEEN